MWSKNNILKSIEYGSLKINWDNESELKTCVEGLALAGLAKDIKLLLRDIVRGRCQDCFKRVIRAEHVLKTLGEIQSDIEAKLKEANNNAEQK